ncbi:MAG: aromatic amino acid transport family protein [Chlamydiota bacterium]
MSQKPGSLLGGALLITGSCVGAGMLGLPILTGLAGFFPALLMFFAAWIFMTLTAFLLVEANGWFSKKVNLLSIVAYSLGKWGKAFCWVAYLFLFYALLVAYVSASGSLCSTFLQGFYLISLPPWVGSVFFVFLFGGVVYQGTRHVDLWNRVLMTGKIIFFLVLVWIGALYIKPELLTRQDLSLSLFSLPILIISFGFHNMIPTLTDYMKGDIKRVKKAILIGGLLAFSIYLIWEILVLGIVPLTGPNGLIETLQLDKEGSQALSAILPFKSISFFAQGLAFFAILTSFLAQALSLVHFLADGLQISHKKKENFFLCLLALLPPLALSLSYPKLFFKALDFAGGICAVILFGVLPVLIVWLGRKQHKSSPTYTLFGGNALLLSICLFSLFIFCFELLVLLGVYNLPRFS